jgi:hypothetical protein
METTKNNLRRGQRYLFYHHAPHEENTTIFRANFVTLYEKSQTLIINNSETERWEKTQVSIPLGWITKIETLEDITNGKFILPSEILLIIDKYL